MQWSHRALGTLGAFVALSATALAAPVQASGSTPGLIWSHSLAGESYHGYTVSIGSQGSQVFSDTGVFTRHTRLYSTEGNLSAPVWQQSSSQDGYEQRVDSSDFSNLHVVTRQEDSALAGFRDVVVECYDSSSQQELWSYTFPESVTGGKVNFVRVAPDGSWVVAAVKGTSSLHLVAFDPVPGAGNPNPEVPFLDVNLPFFGDQTYLGVSDDLSRVYCGNAGHASVYALPSGAEIFDKIVFGGSSRGHAFSADGKTLVYPRNGGFYVLRDSGAGYVQIAHLDPFGGASTYYAGPSALSADGEVLVATYDDLGDQRSVHVMAWDSSSGASLLSRVHTSSHSFLSNNVTDLSMSRSSSLRFALGLTGDGFSPEPEIVVYEQAQGAANFVEHTRFNRPGTAHELDISTNGRRLATSGRDVHANYSSGSKTVETFDLGTDILLRDAPRQGVQKVTVEFYPQSTSAGFLLVSPHPAANPQSTPFGQLYLNRPTIARIPIGFPDAQGRIRHDYPIGGLSLGDTLYFQGLSSMPSGPPLLSDDWASLTLLP